VNLCATKSIHKEIYCILVTLLLKLLMPRSRTFFHLKADSQYQQTIMSDDHTSTMSLIGGRHEKLDTKERRKEELDQKLQSIDPQPTEDVGGDGATGKALHPFVRDAMRA
jgi:hypothetical protein